MCGICAMEINVTVYDIPLIIKKTHQIREKHGLFLSLLLTGHAFSSC